jgi:glycosyltransferase involved in cell wall biosynthesis
VSVDHPDGIHKESVSFESGRIRILFIIGSLDVGGAEKQLVEIALGLDRTRFDAAVCCLGQRGVLAPRLQAGGIPVVAIGMPRASEIGMIAAIATLPFRLFSFFREVRAFRPHVLHGLLFHAYVLGAFAGALLRVPVIVASRRSLSHFKSERRLFQWVERLANRFTDCIVANSDAVRADTLAAEGLPDQAVLVVHNGIEAGRYPVAPQPLLRAGLNAGGGRVAIAVANLIHYKGHQYLIEAWSRVLQEFPDATLLLVGEGPLRASLEAELEARGLTDRVRLLGTRDDVPQLLGASDLLVHPSLEEGFSNALLEGMAAGLPVVATSVGGNPEAIVEGRTGYLVPPRDSDALADAIRRVFRMPDGGRQLGQAGRARVLEQFQLETMIGRYADLYVMLLQRQEGRQQHVRYSGAH